MSKQRETLFKERVLADLKALKAEGRRIWFLKTQMLATRGIPDILVIAGGVSFALELKTSEKARVDKLQLFTLGEMQYAGSFAQVVTPETWPQVLDKIKSNAVKGTVLRNSRLLDS